ncbi:MAG: precorrin-4 C(11)-methyltransferase [Clostridia bacterium]|nr:precorrin-4 C(11)-methyltransferase [Clostridia bacterium]
MVHFVGAGSGAPDLITVRGARLLREADVIIYAGSLVNPELLSYAKKNCEIFDSSKMTLEDVVSVIKRAESAGKTTVRLHTGDPSLFGAVREQYDALSRLGIEFSVCPGVSSFSAAAAALKAEYTLPGVSQSVIISRAAGRTDVPGAQSVHAMSAHKSTMIFFLSAALAEKLQSELIAGGWAHDTPAAVAFRVSWPDEKIIHCTVGTLFETLTKNDIRKTALIIVGDVLGGDYHRSRLYDPGFSTEYREASK